MQIDNAEDLDIVMPMYNLLEYSKNYKKVTGSLRIYYRDEPSTTLSSNSESFKYKTAITGNTYNLGAGEAGYDADRVGKNKTEIVVPVKHLSWSKNCALADMAVRAAGNNNDPTAIFSPTGFELQITDTKLYVPVVTLSTENDKKLLEQLKSGFKRTLKWNKHRSQVTIQPQYNK